MRIIGLVGALCGLGAIPAAAQDNLKSARIEQIDTAPGALARAVVTQDGRNNDVRLRQTSIDARSDIRQMGDDNTIDAVQDALAGGNDRLDATQIGSGNLAWVAQYATGNEMSLISLSQNGQNNIVELFQSGSGNILAVDQSGDDNRAAISQTGSALALSVAQYGSASITIAQTR